MIKEWEKRGYNTRELGVKKRNDTNDDIGKSDEIWQKYLRMKRNRDINLSAYMNDESVKQVIEKKDFEVYMGNF